MSKVIRIDDDIWELLKSKAIPLEDTPSDALRRILLEMGFLKHEPEPKRGGHKDAKESRQSDALRKKPRRS